MTERDVEFAPGMPVVRTLEEVDELFRLDASRPRAESPEDDVLSRGITHREALETEIPETHQHVKDVMDAGTVGVVAGLPFGRKTFLAHEIVHKTAADEGLVLGRFPVLRPGPVVVVWQDDSEENELARIQDYATKHNYSPDLPIRWLLNKGVRLPDDAAHLAQIVRDDGAVLLALDSLYNVLSPNVSLKDEDVAVVLANIKTEIADTTGATVMIVDHSPWPTEGNRGQRRAYGSVFKTAAVRWTIHLEADGKDNTKLHIEASGNNVAGFRRTPAVFDPDTLEIRLVDVEPSESAEQVRERTLAWLETQDEWQSTNEVKKNVQGDDATILRGLFELFETAQIALSVGAAGKTVTPVGADTDTDYHRQGLRRWWKASNHAGLQSVLEPTPTHTDSSPQPLQGCESVKSVRPRRGTDSDTDSLTGQ